MDRPAQVIEVDDKAWAERAMARMDELGATEAQLAAAGGALPAGNGHYLKGRREPSLAKFMLIAHAFARAHSHSSPLRSAAWMIASTNS